MPVIPLANNFLAGSLITLLIPGCVLIAIAAWYTYSVRRLAATRREPTPEVPGPTQPPSSGSTAEREPPGGGS
jgi:hypothetical protein